MFSSFPLRGSESHKELEQRELENATLMNDTTLILDKSTKPHIPPLGRGSRSIYTALIFASSGLP